MEIVFTVLILLLCVALSSALAKISPVRLPLPLVQILMGAILAWDVFNLHVTFEPDWFMLLFIPPLLFADGWRIPKQEFFEQQPAILAMALGLVFFTIFVLGSFVHFLIPSIPLAAAFALAAVLSPTDAVAVSGIFGKRYVPKNVMNLLQGEALMNDASGLVALRFAVAAVLTGTFSIVDASGKFLMVAVGGLVVGVVINWVYSHALKVLVRLGGQDTATEIILLFLLPFAAYLFAEHIGVSGILAAVSAGIAQSYNDLSLDKRLAERLQTHSTWQTLEFTFNGMIFILLGLQFPHIIGHLPNLPSVGIITGEWAALWYVVIIGFALMVIRFVWVWLLVRLLSKRAKKLGKEPAIKGSRAIAIITFAGVRGAVTLAGVLSIPLFLDSGQPFPQRGVLIFLAASLILFSLLCAMIILPILMRGLTNPKEENKIYNVKKIKLLQECTKDALAAVEKAYTEMIEQDQQIDNGVNQSMIELAYAKAKKYYEDRLELLDEPDPDKYRERRQSTITENSLFLRGLEAERYTLFEQHKHKMIDEDIFKEQLRKLDLLEISLRAYQERQHLG
ncbi:Na+/H+ antiporter [Neisseria sp. Ec49-e6-T10]|uniref:Na+/H+ antiporter n=1 Tax=Neisseria sp. Ec49-e6-T10 TaxID=3140744 RepID=UPI003EBD4554